jgi:alcohol dehydrogenase class IV
MYQEFSLSPAITFGWGAVSVLGEKVRVPAVKKQCVLWIKELKSTDIPGKVINILKDAGRRRRHVSGVVADTAG